MTRTEFVQRAVLARWAYYDAPSLQTMKDIVASASALAELVQHDLEGVNEIVHHLHEIDRSLELIANTLPDAGRGT